MKACLKYALSQGLADVRAGSDSGLKTRVSTSAPRSLETS